MVKINIKQSTLEANYKALSELQIADTKEIRGGVGNPIKRCGVTAFLIYKTDLS